MSWEFIILKVEIFHGKAFKWMAYIIMPKTISQRPKYSDLSLAAK